MDFCPRDATPLPPPLAATQFDLSVGLSRRYRVVRRLGEGGMGTVFLAEQLAVGNRLVALKVLRRKLLEDPDFLQRFQDEASSTGRIRHQNVVTVYECGQTDDGSPYIAMEYLEGESLRQTLKRRGSLPLLEAVEILQQAARGLNAAHKLGIIHRDLKPDNIFLTHDDDGQVLVKIVDFGIAKMRESSTHTVTGLAVGTPAYMSFEQASGMRSDELDGRSDIYSLGIVAYELITGRVPFQADTPLAFLRKHLVEPPEPITLSRPDLHISPELDRVVMKALQKERNDRYATAPEFARELAKTASTGSARPLETEVPVREADRLAPQTRNSLPSVPVPQPSAKIPTVTLAPPKFWNSSAQLAALAAVLAVILAGVAWYVLRGRANPNSTAAIDHAAPAATHAQTQTSLPITKQAQSAPQSTAIQDLPSRTRTVIPRPRTKTAPTQANRPDQTQPSEDATRRIKAAIALGDLHYTRGEYDEAVSEYRRGLSAEPSNTVLRTKIERALRAKEAEQRVNQ
jgi:serine/threonine-protein kinase